MTAQPAMLDWQGVLEADAATVGGKAWHLARLKQLGLPVPEGLVIPAGWCPSQEDEAAALSDGIIGCIARRALSARGWLNQPLAVRSSAAGEDSATASFAGIYRTCLNVCGIEQVQAAIREVWASLSSPAAIAYRQKLELGQDAYDARHGSNRHAAAALPLLPALPLLATRLAVVTTGLSSMRNGGWANRWSGDRQTAMNMFLPKICSMITGYCLHQQIGSKAAKAVARPEGGTAMVATSIAEARLVLSSESSVALAELLRDAAVALDFTTSILRSGMGMGRRTVLADPGSAGHCPAPLHLSRAANAAYLLDTRQHLRSGPGAPVADRLVQFTKARQRTAYTGLHSGRLSVAAGIATCRTVPWPPLSGAFPVAVGSFRCIGGGSQGDECADWRQQPEIAVPTSVCRRLARLQGRCVICCALQGSVVRACELRARDDRGGPMAKASTSRGCGRSAR